MALPPVPSPKPAEPLPASVVTTPVITSGDDGAGLGDGGTEGGGDEGEGRESYGSQSPHFAQLPGKNWLRFSQARVQIEEVWDVKHGGSEGSSGDGGGNMHVLQLTMHSVCM